MLKELRTILHDKWERSYGSRPAITSDSGNSCVDSSISIQFGSGSLDFEDFNDLIKKMKSEHAEYEPHADALLHEMRDDDDYPVVDVVRDAARELRHTLELLLLPKDRHNERGLKRKGKTWVF